MAHDIANGAPSIYLDWPAHTLAQTCSIPAHPEFSYQQSGVYSKHCRLSFSPSITKIGQINNFEKEPLAIHHPPCHRQGAGLMYPETELIKMVGNISSPCGPALNVNHARWQGNHSCVINPRNKWIKAVTRSAQLPRTPNVSLIRDGEAPTSSGAESDFTWEGCQQHGQAPAIFSPRPHENHSFRLF